jgi:hypothetical protein
LVMFSSTYSLPADHCSAERTTLCLLLRLLVTELALLRVVLGVLVPGSASDHGREGDLLISREGWRGESVCSGDSAERPWWREGEGDARAARVEPGELGNSYRSMLLLRGDLS